MNGGAGSEITGVRIVHRTPGGSNVHYGGGRDEMKKPKKILYWLHWALLGLVIAVSCVLYLLAIGFVARLVLPN